MARVLVTRPEEAAEKTAALVCAAGHEVLLAPVLRLEARDTQLPAATGGAWQAVLVTSRNAASASARYPRYVPEFAVGEGTAAALGRHAIVPAAVAQGDGVSLARLVGAQLKPELGPLLHPTGTVRAEALESALVAAGFDYHAWVVYAAEPVAALPQEVREALGSGAVDAVTLYSPRTARLFLTLIGEAGLDRALSDVVALTLSPNVAAAAAAAAWREVRVAAQPDERGMAALLEELEH